jgi:hypothetical protein
MFDRVSDGEPPVVDTSIQLLKVMLTVYRPLREEEVSSATGLHLENAGIELLVDRCASFVEK